MNTIFQINTHPATMPSRMFDPMLEKELAFFKAHQAELVQQYQGKFLVIKDEAVKGVYDSEMEAYTEAQKSFQLGSFLIQQCVSGTEGYTQTFHSRVTSF
ncbi:MAG: hypothetical protein JWM92_592 [Candidatus Nomurabacteria bacterium]|nr:hypothetical protein [Candidatus Nomurabacteria bacterium]